MLHERGQYQELELTLEKREKTLADIKSQLVQDRSVLDLRFYYCNDYNDLVSIE